MCFLPPSPQKLDYFCTECIYAPFAARGAAREFVKDLEVGRGEGRLRRATLRTFYKLQVLHVICSACMRLSITLEVGREGQGRLHCWGSNEQQPCTGCVLFAVRT